MKAPRFSQLTPEEQDWIDAYLDGTIAPEAFAALQDRMMHDPALRAAMRRYLALDSSLQAEGGGDEGAFGPWLAAAASGVGSEAPGPRGRWVAAFAGSWVTGAAAAAALGAGLAFVFWPSPPVAPPGHHPSAESAAAEPSASGFAAVERLDRVVWADGAQGRREGDTLGAETFRLVSGVAQIQFFSGATMTVEGPAEIGIKSAWEAVCLEGAVRMRVPPPARGFKLHAPSTEIVDLGTEFGLVVREGRGHVEVFDGEIEVRQQGSRERRVGTGSALELAPGRPATPTEAGRMVFPDEDGLGARAIEQRRASFDRWRAYRDALARDERLIAYYTFETGEAGALIPDITLPRNPELDGAVVLAEPVDGRWPGMKPALEFRRPGARVRVNIPGEFRAFTFACWVRIDSLDRWYNALFMGDGYETGEPHWQIRDDGKLMLSVMVDDSKPHPIYPKKSRYHHVYFSPPFWDRSMSGQWLHLASVFDPEQRAVSHYVNGERLSREPIAPAFQIEVLRIGNGEIGNWGQPFREDPKFAIRNLNGRMDEIAVFRAALGDEEIARLYERSRSDRH